RGAGGDKGLDRHRHALAQHRVDTAHRLVEDHELGLGHPDAGQIDEPLLASAEVSGTLVAELRETELVEDLAGSHQLIRGGAALTPAEPDETAEQPFAARVPACHDD